MTGALEAWAQDETRGPQAADSLQLSTGHSNYEMRCYFESCVKLE